MRTIRFILSLIVLILTILVTKSSNAETTCIENNLGDQTCITITTTTTGVAGVTTDNLLSPNFQDGTWTHIDQDFHGSNILATTGNSTSSSTVSLTDDAGLSKTQINAGFSSTLGADIWFWSGVNSTVTLRQTLTDDNGNVITQHRNITSAINNNYTNYTDTIIVNPNSQQNYNITASLENVSPGYSPYQHVGPDIRNPSLLVTTNDTFQTSTTSAETFTYCYDRVPNACTYDNTALEQIANFKTDDGKSYDEYINEVVKIEELTEDFKMANIETTFIVEDLDGKFEEIKIEDYAIESFSNFIETNNLTETFETALIEEDLGREEFFDTMADSIKEEFGEEFDMSGNDFKTEDLTTEGGPSDLTTQSETEELKTETETSQIEDANADTTTTKKTEEVSNETSEESTSTETVSNESSMDKDSQTEGSETETDNNQTVENKEISDVKTTDVAVNSIEKKVERVIAKVLSKLKDVDKKLQAVQYLTTKGITAGQADISGYINKRVYLNQKQIPEISFYSNVNILEQQQIYNNVSLEQYTSNDLIGKKQKQLFDVQEDINRIKAEIYALKQKRG